MTILTDLDCIIIKYIPIIIKYIPIKKIIDSEISNIDVSESSYLFH